MRTLPVLSLLTFGLLSSLAAATPLTVTLNVTHGSEPFRGQLTTQAGQIIETQLWKLYISNVALVGVDGTEVPVPGLNLLSLTGETGSQRLVMIQGDVPVGQYRGLRFDVGIPRDLNHRDASTQPAPLGLDSGMFWAWNPGYVFSRFEGKAQVDGQTKDVALHMGGDNRRLTVNLSDSNKPPTIRIGSEPATVNVTLDAARMVSQGAGGAAFDLRQPPYTQVHSGPVADQLHINLADAFRLMTGAGTLPHTR